MSSKTVLSSRKNVSMWQNAVHPMESTLKASEAGPYKNKYTISYKYTAGFGESPLIEDAQQVGYGG